MGNVWGHNENVSHSSPKRRNLKQKVRCHSAIGPRDVSEGRGRMGMAEVDNEMKETFETYDKIK